MSGDEAFRTSIDGMLELKRLVLFLAVETFI